MNTEKIYDLIYELIVSGLTLGCMVLSYFCAVFFIMLGEDSISPYEYTVAVEVGILVGIVVMMSIEIEERKSSTKSSS